MKNRLLRLHRLGNRGIKSQDIYGIFNVSYEDISPASALATHNSFFIQLGKKAWPIFKIETQVITIYIHIVLWTDLTFVAALDVELA